MSDFIETLKRKFPVDENLGFYLTPNFPATKLGKVLMSFTKISGPTDVIAFYLHSGLFSSNVVLFTKDMCYFESNSFRLEDIAGTEIQDKNVKVAVNQGGSSVTNLIKTHHADAAKLLERVLSGISSTPKVDEFMPKTDYSIYSKESVNWLEIRDEVMKTIDMLNEKFMDGKISLLEFEDKKLDLLSRL